MRSHRFSATMCVSHRFIHGNWFLLLGSVDIQQHLYHDLLDCDPIPQTMVNYGNKQTFTNNFGFCEVSKVPLTRVSPLIRGARGVGDLGGWLCIGSVQVILKSTINEVSENNSVMLSPKNHCRGRSCACPHITQLIFNLHTVCATLLATSKCQHALVENFRFLYERFRRIVRLIGYAKRSPKST